MPVPDDQHTDDFDNLERNDQAIYRRAKEARDLIDNGDVDEARVQLNRLMSDLVNDDLLDG